MPKGGKTEASVLMGETISGILAHRPHGKACLCPRRLRPGWALWIVKAFIKFKKKARTAETDPKPSILSRMYKQETRHEKSRQTFAERGKGGRLSGAATMGTDNSNLLLFRF